MQKVKLATSTGEILEGSIISITPENYLIEWQGHTPIWIPKTLAKLFDNGYPIRIVEIINEQKDLLCD